jgi:4-hydroxybenzoate polyprenyltransferase
MSIWKRLRLTLEMIKFEHSVFALPFALTGALLAWRSQGFPMDGLAMKLFWIVVAMVAARSAAMTFNRVLDADIDAENPRTKDRHLPAGRLSRGFAWGFISVCVTAFLAAAWELNTLCLILAFPTLAVLFFYSYTKRFTSYSHLVLGFTLGMAPSAAWIAVTGSLDPRIVLLTLAVMFWTAGFDIIYACQDFEYDSKSALFSMPKRLGIARSLWVARILHVAMIACLLLLVQSFGLGAISFAGVSAVALLLIYEHSLVKPDDLSRVNAAFFTVNGYVSVLFFLFWAADIYFNARGNG